MYLLGAIVLIGSWAAFCIWVARRAVRLTTRPHFKVLIFVVLLPVLFVLPVADELIGKYQYERYCREAEEVKIYGTIPVGEDFYTADGKWKPSDMSLPLEERNRLQSLLSSILRWDLGSPFAESVPSTMPIQYQDTKIYEVKTGRLLADFRVYSTHGGRLSRRLYERGGLFVEPQCLPPLLRSSEIDQKILPFNEKLGGQK